MNILVVGGDGLIGKSVCEYVIRTEEELNTLEHTTRRKTHSEGPAGILFLDLLKPERFNIKREYHLAFLCAGINGFKECEGATNNSWRVNVDGVLNVAMRLIKHYNTFVVYPSTQAVEWSALSYARQRAQVEAVLLATYKAAIVRVAKVTDNNRLNCAKTLFDIGLAGTPGVYQWPA